MSDVIDFARKRFEKAKDCTETTVADCLREALRQIEAGELKLDSVIIVGIREDDDGTYVENFHAGPASTNERVGVLHRAQSLMLRGSGA